MREVKAERRIWVGLLLLAIGTLYIVVVVPH